VRGHDADIYGTLVENDCVLVLYNPQKSSECVPLCATNYEFPKP